MKLILPLLFIGLLSISCKKEPEVFNSKSCLEVNSRSNTHSLAMEIQSVLDQATSEQIPGISLVVNSASHGFYMGTSGIADLSSGTGMQTCHTFRVASLTKTLLAAAIFQLIEAGEFGLNDQISTILEPGVLDGLPKAYETTVAELLSHTSGIPNYDDNSRFVATVLNEPGKKLTVADRLNFAKDLRGTSDEVINNFGYIYSNTNYVLLELILEKVTGTMHELYLQQNLLDPLGLQQSSFSTMDPFPSGLVTGYCDMYDNGKLRDVSLFDARRWSGESSMISNPYDVYIFFEALLNGGIFPQPVVEQMQDNRYGLLRETFNGATGFGHDGLAIGYSSEMWFFPELDLTIVLTVNKGRIDSEQPSIQDFEQLFLDILEMHASQ